MLRFFGLDFNKVSLRGVAANLALIVLGSLITSVGINAFLVPHKFLSGGVSGISQFLSYLTPVSVGTYLLLLNIPVFAFGWRYVGRTFVIGSLVGTITLSLGLYATEWMAHTGWAPEKMLSALIGGAMSGAGTGLVFRANSSHGGADIIAAAVKRRWSLSIGTVIFAINAVIVTSLGFVYGLHAALYTIVAQLVSAVAVDKVIIGLDRSQAIFIISAEHEKIAELITRKLGRGVTYLEGEGAYQAQKRRIIYCVVSLGQLARVKHYVQTTDPKAFMTVAEASEVLGKGFRSVHF